MTHLTYINQDYGSVDYLGKTYKLMQHPYLADDGEFYTAHAVDDEGNDFRIFWYYSNRETEDEGDSCNWENFELYDESKGTYL